MVGTAKNNKDFVATLSVKEKGNEYIQIVIQSTNGVCGPWKWKADLIHPDQSFNATGNGAVHYHHEDAPADWFKYWIICAGTNIDGYMAGFSDLERLTANWNQLANPLVGVVYVE
jgi:hypothetical protein